MTKKIAVVGATGRMGKLALELIEASQDLSVFAALDSKSELTAALGADAIFDVTRLDVSENVVAFAQTNQLPIVVGTSGWSKDKLAGLDSNGSAVVVIPNFSVGSMLATRFAAEAAKFFDSIEIIEAHHAGKVDSPSGTAVRTAELIAANRGNTPLVPGVGQEARERLLLECQFTAFASRASAPSRACSWVAKANFSPSVTRPVRFRHTAPVSWQASDSHSPPTASTSVSSRF